MLEDLKPITFEDYQNLKYGDVIVFNLYQRSDFLEQLKARDINSSNSFPIGIFKYLGNSQVRLISTYGFYISDSGIKDINSIYGLKFLADKDFAGYFDPKFDWYNCMYIDKSNTFNISYFDFDYCRGIEIAPDLEINTSKILTDTMCWTIFKLTNSVFSKNKDIQYSSRTISKIRTRLRNLCISSGFTTVYPDVSITFLDAQVKFHVTHKIKLPKPKPDKPPKYNRLVMLKQ